MKLIPGTNDFATLRPDLMKEWDFSKNVVKPTECKLYSRQNVWWICSQGHSWEMSIYKRTHEKYNCPICGQLHRIMRFQPKDSLLAKNPKLAAEWHPTKNAPLTPDSVGCYSNHKAWWICDKGHSWQAYIHNRAIGAGCPYCAKHKAVEGEGDLQTAAPHIAKEWHPSKNGDLHPNEVSVTSHRRVWWQCEYGHEWQAEIRNRTKYKHSKCPVCQKSKKSPR